MTAPVERAWREERAQILATLTWRLGDLDLAEDAVQEAFAAAAVRWPVDGVPQRPGAWLMTTAWRKALDVLRRERPAGGGDDALAQLPAPAGAPEAGGLAVEDDRLRLVLACCHPSLALDARVALTLRHVAGLTAREIAAAFLLPEAPLTKRLVRARTKIRIAGISFELPGRCDLPQRLAAVHAVLYLIFTEGHLASGDGNAVRQDLCEEAVWLGRQLHDLLPDDTETVGLLALMLLTHARTGARTNADGGLIPYDEQDHERWDATLIAEAQGLLAVTIGGPLGPYQVQAAIAALHAVAPDGDSVRWTRIADLYAVLARLAPSPVVEVNRAVAVGRAHGANEGLAILAAILREGRLDEYAPLHAAHADLLDRAGDREGARRAWLEAARVAENPKQSAELRIRAGKLLGPTVL